MAARSAHSSGAASTLPNMAFTVASSLLTPGCACAEAEAMLQAAGGVISAPAAAAISAARSAYSPYTRCPAGVAVVTGNGGIYAGFCMESAAHNPGMLPLQAALVAALVYGGLPDYEAVSLHVQLDWQDEAMLPASLQ